MRKTRIFPSSHWIQAAKFCPPQYFDDENTVNNRPANWICSKKLWSILYIKMNIIAKPEPMLRSLVIRVLE